MRSFTALLCLLALAAPAGAEVKIATRADGLKVIYNEAPRYRERRQATALVPVPEPGWEPLIDDCSRSLGLEPRLVRAVIQVESGYNPRALSNKGAMGLMQLMPATARELAVGDPYDPGENLRAGTAYLRRMLDRFDHRLEWALAAYNAGPSAVEEHRGVPPYEETRAYVRRVLGLYRGDSAAPSPQGRTPFIVRRGGRVLITTDPPG
jgi:soluble lytic murein transglycosylase-like protein